jgi:hypothetical protein
LLIEAYVPVADIERLAGPDDIEDGGVLQIVFRREGRSGALPRMDAV